MAPEVARGEEQGPAADVWALGCTVLEMATGHAPWSGVDGDAIAALHRIGYTDAMPEVPQWLSAEAKDFLAGCLVRQAGDRCTVAQLLEHPFLASATSVHTKLDDVKTKWVSPKSTLDAAFWESESDTDDELSASQSSAERIKALACPASALPDWDADDGWIDVLSSAPTEGPDSNAVAVPAEETAGLDDASTSEEATAETAAVLDIFVGSTYSSNVGESCDDSVVPTVHQPLQISFRHELVPCKLFCDGSTNAIDQVLAQTPRLALLLCSSAHSTSSSLHCDTFD
jgi:serine/threonine protein kinase